MIAGFRHTGLEALCRTGSARGIPSEHEDRLLRIPAALDAAGSAADLNHPGFKLHGLEGRPAGHRSIRVDGDWRVTFRFAGGDVERVDFSGDH